MTTTMDNPWATAWDDQDTSWSPESPETGGTVWLQGDPSWDSSIAVDSRDRSSEQDITVQAQRGTSYHSTEPLSAPPAFVSDYHSPRVASPSELSHPVPETNDATQHNVASATTLSDKERAASPLDRPDDDWKKAWATAPSSDTSSPRNHPSDQWEAARQNKENFNRSVPPDLLDTLLRHCQQVSEEIWPTSQIENKDNWHSGFDNHGDIATLLAQLVPADSTLPPPIHFSATATAKAMNEALKLTRHLPTSASSPLSRLLASKGSMEWEKSITTRSEVIPDSTHVGWRVLEKENRHGASEEPKPRKATGGLLSFWNRRASAIQVAVTETPSERSSSPSKSSQENINSAHPSSSQAALPSKASVTSGPPLPPIDAHPAVVTVPAPSAVSRFLNRFARSKSAQHSSLALSTDDLEFLSDIVPSASDLPDEVDDSTLDALTGVNISSPLPSKLPPPIPPPPKQPTMSSRPPSAFGLGVLNNVVTRGVPTSVQVQADNHACNIPVLAPPTSSKSVPPFSRSQSLLLSSRDVSTSSSRPSSQPYSSFTLPTSHKTPSSPSIPPPLPPLPVSPPQTPRPGTFADNLSTVDTSGLGDSDDEFSAFTSFPPSAPAPLAFSESYLSQGPPSPPSPPPRRTYERTHYPSSSSASILSPTSQTSLDQLYSTRSSISASLDSFDDFVSPPSIVPSENRKCTPSPPPLPIKPHSQHQKPPRLDTKSSCVYHAHIPSQTFASPTARTSLLSSAFSVSSVSNAEHQRTQTLVNHAAAQGGMLWPNSPDLDEPRAKTIPPPPSTSTSPKTLIGEKGFDLLGDNDPLNVGMEALSSLPSVVGATEFGASTPSPALEALRAPLRVADGLKNQLQSSPSPVPSTPAAILSSFSRGVSVPSAVTNPRPGQVHSKQMGGLSAQDLSFFEGL